MHAARRAVETGRACDELLIVGRARRHARDCSSEIRNAARTSGVGSTTITWHAVRHAAFDLAQQVGVNDAAPSRRSRAG